MELRRKAMQHGLDPLHSKVSAAILWNAIGTKLISFSGRVPAVFTNVSFGPHPGKNLYGGLRNSGEKNWKLLTNLHKLEMFA